MSLIWLGCQIIPRSFCLLLAASTTQFLFGTVERRIGDLLFDEDGDLIDLVPDKSILAIPGESFFVVLFLNPGLIDFRPGEEGEN